MTNLWNNDNCPHYIVRASHFKNEWPLELLIIIEEVIGLNLFPINFTAVMVLF